MPSVSPGGACPDNGDTLGIHLLWQGNDTLARRAVIRGEALEIADGDGQVKLAAAADLLAGCSADAATDGWEGIGLGGDLERFIIAPLGNQADVEPGVGADRAGRLAGCPQVLSALPQPGAPALPGSLALGDMPGAALAPWRLAWLCGVGAGIGVERLPACFWWQVRDGAAFGIGDFLDEAPDSDGVGGAFLGADLAANTRGHLHGREHHPGTR